MKKVYINPGHSDKDPGAVGYETERKLNVKVAQYENEYLLANYVCETKVGYNDDLMVVVAEANSWGADLFDSKHMNAGGGDGYEGYVYSQARVPLGKIYAKYVQEAGQNLRLYGAAPGVKINPNLTVLKDTAMPAILTEGAFVDNLKDIQDWNEDAELKRLGEAYAKAAAEFLGLEKKVVKPEAEGVQAEYFDLPALSKGSKGDSVKALQILLIGYGYSCGSYGADGDFGAATENALKKYKGDRKLAANGVCDLETWRKLIGVE